MVHNSIVSDLASNVAILWQHGFSIVEFFTVHALQAAETLLQLPCCHQWKKLLVTIMRSVFGVRFAMGTFCWLLRFAGSRKFASPLGAQWLVSRLFVVFQLISTRRRLTHLAEHSWAKTKDFFVDERAAPSCAVFMLCPCTETPCIGGFVRGRPRWLTSVHGYLWLMTGRALSQQESFVLVCFSVVRSSRNRGHVLAVG